MMLDPNPTTLQISDPVMIRAVELLQTGNYFITSWHDFKLIACVLFAAGMITGYCLAKANIHTIKTKIREALNG